jgi:uncharacterized membrane protein SirB2
MSFLLLKGLHITCAFTSYILFLLRGIWGLNGSSIMRQRWVRIVPHVVDTLLLASAIVLAVTIQQYPFADAWITAKVIGVSVYIGLGFVALKLGKSKRIRLLAWVMAQAVFAYILLVAVQHSPVSFFTEE